MNPFDARTLSPELLKRLEEERAGFATPVKTGYFPSTFRPRPVAVLNMEPV